MKKGGYKIIDLKNLDLLVGIVLIGIYNEIEGSYRKPILLSGINIDGVEKNDVFVIPELVGTTFVLRNVYGHNVEINEDDEISINDLGELTDLTLEDFTFNEITTTDEEPATFYRISLIKSGHEDIVKPENVGRKLIFYDSEYRHMVTTIAVIIAYDEPYGELVLALLHDDSLCGDKIYIK